MEYLKIGPQTILKAFKQRFGFRRCTLRDLKKSLMLQGKTLIVDSFKSEKGINDKYRQLPCVECEDVPRIGKRALDIISSEIVGFMQHVDVYPCRVCLLRQGCPELALLCGHMMDDRELMRPHALHPRYLRDDMERRASDVHIISVTTETGLTNKYSDIVA